MNELESQVNAVANAAKAASAKLALASEDLRNNALAAMAQALRANVSEIILENEKDVAAAREKGTKESLIDRLMLNETRVFDMASALEDLIDLPDPLNTLLESRKMYNGISLERVSVPLGVVAVVYEARPNVTADAAGICLKAGNAVVLRGGSMAHHSNVVISRVLADAAYSAGLPQGCIGVIDSTDRSATDILMSLRGVVDVLVPRGGAGLINHCVECAKVPVIETGTGNCHVYVHGSADISMAHDIVINAKCRRFGVCNAAETLLVDRSIAQRSLEVILPDLADHGVELHADEESGAVADSLGLAFMPADETDWKTEYLAPEIAIRVVDDIDSAIDHINRYGTKHSEAIVAQDKDAQDAFVSRVDASSVYINASTAFTDGGQFGLGAEIGISTQKLHARGPFALEGLTSYKYVLRGSGQVRD